MSHAPWRARSNAASALSKRPAPECTGEIINLVVDGLGMLMIGKASAEPDGGKLVTAAAADMMSAAADTFALRRHGVRGA